ncbi:MAG TPA: threonine aldolase, partial [Anaerolineales bacterium]|nr:threonine aldolase [Anaerolineales bacterium]
HRLARRLAEGLASIPDLALVYGMPKANMVFLSLAEASRLDARLIGERLSVNGVRVHVTGPCSFRLVTHYGIGDAAVEKTVAAFQDVMRPT